jgi:hypothetical protein
MMLGTVKHTTHPKTRQLLEAVSNTVPFPKKIQSLDILRKRRCLIAPRFGGRSIYLWVKGKTRVWVDRKQVYLVNTSLPDYTRDGTLMCAELFKNDNNKWVMAFEDIIIYKGDTSIGKGSFEKRQEILREIVSDLLKGADTKSDPGVFCVKPWYTPNEYPEKIKNTEWSKNPDWAIVWAEDDKRDNVGSFWFCKTRDTSTSNVYRISRSSDPNPDQYDLLDSDGNIVHKACVRTLRASQWLRALEDGSRVKCRNVPGIVNPEPYEMAL